MYILPNGESISEQDIQYLADENDISFYEIINEVGIKEFDDVDEEEYHNNPIKIAGNIAASVGSGVADLFGGGANLIEAIAEQGVLSYMNLSDQFTEDDFTDEDRAKYLQQIEDYVKVDETMEKASSILQSLKTKHKYELFEDAVADGEYLQALDMGLSDLGGSLPSMAASMYAGPLGIVALGLSEAGNSYEDLSKASNEDRGLWMFGNAALQGTIEAGTELLFNKIFKGLSVVDTAGKILLQKSIGKTLSAAGRIGAGAASEAVTENMAQEANNALDGVYMESKFRDENGDVDYYSIKRRVLHTAVIAGIMGGGATGMQVRNDLVTSALTPEAYSRKNVEHAENILKLKATKKNISKNGASTLEIDEQIKNLEDAIDYNNKSVSEVVNSLSNEEKANQAILKKDIVDLEIQLKNSNLNDLSKQSLQQSIEAKKKQFNDLFNNKKKEVQEKRDAFDSLNSDKEAFDLYNEFSKLKNKDIYIKKASSELSLEGKELTDESLDQTASNIYVNEKLSIKYDQLNSSAKKRADKKYKGKIDILEINGDITEESSEFNRVIEKINQHYDASALSEEQKNQRKKEVKNGLLNGTVDGVNIPAVEGYNDNKATIITARQNAIRNGKIATLSHELLHLEMDQKFTDADQTVKGKELLDYLSKNEKQLHARVIQRLNNSYAERNEDGVLEKDSNYYLESLNALNDILAFNPNFKKNKNLITKVKEFINSVFGREVLKTNDDVFSFVEAYSKSSNFNENSEINKKAEESFLNKSKELDDRVAELSTSFSKSDFPNLIKHDPYIRFQKALKGVTFYHGGTRTIDQLNKSNDENHATWWYAGDEGGASMYAGSSVEIEMREAGFNPLEIGGMGPKGKYIELMEEADIRTYKEKFNPRDQLYKLEFDKIKDTIIIPDIEDSASFRKFYNKKYPEVIKEFNLDVQLVSSKSDIRSNTSAGLMDIPVEQAESILMEYMTFVEKNGLEEDLGVRDVYDIDNFAPPVVVMGKINSNLIENIDIGSDFEFLEEKYEDYDKKISSTKFSKTDAFVKKINDLVPPSSTKESWKRGGISNAYMAITTTPLFNDLIKGRLEPGDNIYGQPKDQIIDEIKFEIGVRLSTFDPDFLNAEGKHPGLAGWLGIKRQESKSQPRGIIQFAVGDVTNKYKKETKIKTTSINKTRAGKDGSEMSMDIEDDSVTETVKERKERESTEKEVVVGKKGFQGETRKPLKDSIDFESKETNSEFKLEVAKVLSTINIPITSKQQDFISKFREELTGRKYFKDSKGKTKQTVSLKDAWTLVRTESGWKNKSNYEAFLLKNKEALLNGLTTTYLSKAFPSAIEKFVVDGVDSNGNVTGNFTTSWNPKAKTGKKPGDIDFIKSVEDVSQLEGDKTGKQRMRRVSNVKQSVTDETWIDHFKTGKQSWPQMKSEPMWREIAGEMGYEVLQEEINKLDEYVESIEQITEDPGLNSDQVKTRVDEINNSDEFNIISKLYQNQESMNSFIIDSTVANLNKQLDRGVTKFSKSKEKSILEALNEIKRLNDLDPKQYTIENALYAIVESGNFPKDITEGLESILPENFSQYRGSNKQEKEVGKKIQEVLRSNPDIEITMKQSLANTKGDFVFFDKNGNRLFAVEHKTKPSDPLGGHTLSPNGEVKMPISQASAYIRDLLDSEGFQYKFKGGKRDGKVKQTWSSLTNKQKILVMTKFGDPSEVTDTLTERKKKVLEEKFKQENKELIDYVEKVIKAPLEDLRIKWINTYNKIATSEGLNKIESISDKNINKDIRRRVEKDKSLTKYVLIKDKNLKDKKNKLVSKTYSDQGTKYASYGTKGTISPIDINKDLGLDVTVRVVSSGKYIYGRVFYSIPKQQISIAENNIKNQKNKINLTDKGSIPFLSSIKLSKSNGNLSENFNKIIEQNKNVDASKIFSDSTAKLDGATVGTYKFFVPPSAEDFMGLMYSFLGKGKVGDAQKNFFEETLNGPYKRGISKMESEKQRIEDFYTEARKRFPEIVKKLGKKIPGTSYTYDQAIRVHLWKTGIFDQKVIDSIGLSDAEINMLNKTVTDDSRMQQFAREVGKSTGLPEGYIPPSDYWLVDTIASDLNRVVDTVGRKKFLNEFIENKKQIFDKDNLNKIEAVYGSNFREALEDILKRMETGNNNTSGKNRLVNRYTKWLNNSVGAIMFFNMRSATLQTISAINFMNWSDNNPLMAAKAFANQKQFWKDFVTIFNSDKLKQRRKGLKTDVNTAELASSVADSKDKAKAALNYLLKIGFAPTQLADSFAIAVGGASMYRNRANTYKKKGMSAEKAEKAAFEDFAAVAEESQQSSDPALVSQQQSGPLGRFILAFQNTPMQYNRLMKKAARDLKNRRGDWKTNLSKVVYYGAVQNLIFSTLSNALFAMAFDDDDTEDQKKDKINKKEIRVVNNMLDTILRGSGVGGAAVATVKNGIMKYYEQENKEYGKDHAFTILELVNYSPPIGKKLRNVYSAIKSSEWEKDVIVEKGFSIDSPIYKVGGSLASAAFNIPLDRVVNKAHNVKASLDLNNSRIQRILLALGWNTWDLNIKNEENELIKTNAKDARRKAGYKKAAETRRRKNEQTGLQDSELRGGLQDSGLKD